MAQTTWAHVLNHPCLSKGWLTGDVQQQKNSIYFYKGGEQNPKRLSNLRGGIPTAHKSASDESFFSDWEKAESKLCWPEGLLHHPPPSPSACRNFYEQERRDSIASEEETPLFHDSTAAHRLQPSLVPVCSATLVFSHQLTDFLNKKTLMCNVNNPAVNI